MRLVVQRVKEARVLADGIVMGRINLGLLVFLGVEYNDELEDVSWLVKKVLGIRIFSDGDGKMNCSLNQVNASVLVVSQFTLCANLRKGSRPSFIKAAPPKIGESLYNYFVSCLKKNNAEVQTGKFGANMDVELVNQGPATFIIDSKI